jgi:hypothetical protein
LCWRQYVVHFSSVYGKFKIEIKAGCRVRNSSLDGGNNNLIEFEGVVFCGCPLLEMGIFYTIGKKT